MDCLEYIEKWNTFHTLPIKDVFFEEMLYHFYQGQGFQVKWNPGSHKSGVDLIVNGKRISCKSTLLKRLKKSNRGSFYLSSYRTTKAKNLSERKAIIRDNDLSFDEYNLLIREKTKIGFSYLVLKVDKNIFNIDNYSDGIHKEYKFISYRIVESNSQQLWFSIGDYEKFMELPGVFIIAYCGAKDA